MGTRGAYGFLLSGREKVTYHHSDSYPEYLGTNILIGARTYLQTAAGLARARQFVSELVMLADNDENYWRLRDSQGNIGLLLCGALSEMIDNADFLQDSLFCEWAYIINLDDNVLEVYKGFNTDPLAKGRYARHKAAADAEYYGVALIWAYPLDNLPDPEQFVNDIRALSQKAPEE